MLCLTITALLQSKGTELYSHREQVLSFASPLQRFTQWPGMGQAEVISQKFNLGH